MVGLLTALDEACADQSVTAEGNGVFLTAADGAQWLRGWILDSMVDRTRAWLEQHRKQFAAAALLERSRYRRDVRRVRGSVVCSGGGGTPSPNCLG